LRLRSLRIPLLIFLSLVSLSIILGFSIIYSTIAANRNGDYLHLKKEVLEIDLPLNWFAYSWEIANETTKGRIFGLIMFGYDVVSAISIQIFDRSATRQFLLESNLSDLSLASFWETRRFYEWTSQNNENASIISEENGTLSVGVSRDPAKYARILIKDGLEIKDSFYNVSCTVISYMKGDNFVRIVFWGRKEDCERISYIFEKILSTMVVKSYGSK